MASEVSICNLAISTFGLGKTISALDEASAEATQCNIQYENARDQTLEEHDWKFASVEQSLALTGTAPARWGYSYALPSNCIIPREIINTSSEDPIEYEVALSSDLTTRLIYTDRADAVLRYTAKVTDPNKFSIGFINALYCRVAMGIALPLTQKDERLQAASRLFAIMLSSAQVNDANTGHKFHERDASWTSSR